MLLQIQNETILPFILQGPSNFHGILFGPVFCTSIKWFLRNATISSSSSANIIGV